MKQARRILESIRAAISADSKLLIHENIMPEKNVSLYEAELDLYMMAIFSSLNRTETKFRKLLESVGMQVHSIWRPEGGEAGAGTLLECVLRD